MIYYISETISCASSAVFRPATSFETRRFDTGVLDLPWLLIAEVEEGQEVVQVKLVQQRAARADDWHVFCVAFVHPLEALGHAMTQRSSQRDVSHTVNRKCNAT